MLTFRHELNVTGDSPLSHGKNSKNADAYRDLPETFGVKDVMEVLGIEQDASSKQCQRWLVHGFVERLKKGKYRKIMKEIMI